MRSNDRLTRLFLTWLVPAFVAAMAATPAGAQTGEPLDTTGAANHLPRGERPTLELVLEKIDGQVACRTERPRLPAYTPINLRLTNHSGGPAVFSAIPFLVTSKNLKSEDKPSNDFLGRIGLKDKETVELELRTPERPGEYAFACVERGGFRIPGPSGVIAEPVKTDGVFVVVRSQPIYGRS